MSDPSVEAERIAQTLRTTGYTVVDVPLSMLVARVAVQRPRIILVDADGDGALEAVGRMRELPDADDIDVIFLGRLGGAFSRAEDALAHEGSGFFPRPVDVPGLVSKVIALTGVVAPPKSKPSSPPPSMPSSSVASVRPVSTSLPPASMRQLEPSSSRPPAPRTSAAPRLSQRPIALDSPMAMASDVSKRAVSTPLSPELEDLLAEAEQRVPVQLSPESVPPTPEEEIEAVLPAELLEALDLPIEQDDDDDAAHESSMPMSRMPTTGSGKHTTGVGGGAPITGTGVGARARTSSAPKPVTGELALTPAPVKTHGGTQAGTTSGVGGTTGAGSDGERARSQVASANELPRGASQPPPTAYSGAPREIASRATRDDASRASPGPASTAAMQSAQLHPGPAAVPNPAAPMLSVLGPGDAPRVVARAIATRTTGALAVDGQQTEQAQTCVRRVLLREGDLVTAASTSEDDSLIAFLGARGDLPRETVRRLAGKFPPFGRHAGAALVAHGYLRQDQLWPTLRAHAEWILGRVLQATSGNVFLEAEPPGRLRVEPGVFGGSTGAEVFVEVLRRVVAPSTALEQLGGGASRIADGESASMLSECALNARELELMTQARGNSVQQMLDLAPDTDLATVIYAASLLGVVEVLRSVGHVPAGDRDGESADVDALDEDAIRERVRARVQLVEEGDYFSLLGVPRNATGYEVKRAFIELRRAFEPGSILSPQVADLADDVRKIVMVLEEAYEILRDAARRERYRRAIG